MNIVQGASGTVSLTDDPSDALFLFSIGSPDQCNQGLCVFTPALAGFSIEVTPVQGGAPEPSTLALLVVGFGAMLRRRRFQ